MAVIFHREHLSSLWPRHLSLLSVRSLGTLVEFMGDVNTLVMAQGDMVRPRMHGLLFLDVKFTGSAHRFDFYVSAHCTC